MPIYATSEESEETAGIDDAIVQLSTSNVPTGSRRFIATVIGAYVIFGYAMYNMMQEFQWFYMNRYAFLKKPLPRNYAVYVQNIPEEYQTRQKLYEYFSRFAMMGHLMTAVDRAGYDTMAKYGRGDGNDSGVYEAVISLQVRILSFGLHLELILVVSFDPTSKIVFMIVSTFSFSSIRTSSI